MKPIKSVLDLVRHFQRIVFGMLYHRRHHCVDACAGFIAEDLYQVGRDILLSDDVGTDGIVDIVVDIGDPVGKTDDPSFHSVGFLAEVQSLTVLFEYIHNTQTLLIVAKTALHQVVERSFACMTKRRMPEIVR